MTYETAGRTVDKAPSFLSNGSHFEPTTEKIAFSFEQSGGQWNRIFSRIIFCCVRKIIEIDKGVFFLRDPGSLIRGSINLRDWKKFLHAFYQVPRIKHTIFTKIFKIHFPKIFYGCDAKNRDKNVENIAKDREINDLENF